MPNIRAIILFIMHDMSDIFYNFAVAMKKTILLVICGIYALVTQAQTMDTTAYNLNLEEVVVTGTRRAENVRFLPMTVSIISRQKLTQQHQTSVLPTVMQHLPEEAASLLGQLISQ